MLGCSELDSVHHTLHTLILHVVLFHEIDLTKMETDGTSFVMPFGDGGDVSRINSFV